MGKNALCIILASPTSESAENKFVSRVSKISGDYSSGLCIQNCATENLAIYRLTRELFAFYRIRPILKIKGVELLSADYEHLSL